MNKSYIYIGGGVIIALAVLVAIWFLFFTGTPVSAPISGNSSFGASDTRTSVNNTQEPATNAQTPIISSTSGQKIFKISDGPVAGATLIESSRPTTTVARFVMADSGHLFDLAVDSPGAVAKAISNTTIPGIQKVFWSEGGRGALMQYIDSGVTKTAHFALPGVASTTRVVVQFLQNNITSLAVSPDGASVAYLIKTAGGADGYNARADGATVKKLFSMPLSQLSLSWPSPSTLLAVSAPAAGVSGGAFAIDAKTGAAAPLLFADGLSATADRSFTHVIYQTAGGTRTTYSLNTKTGLATPLSFDPLPEQCIFSLPGQGAATSTLMYCAAPLQYVDTTYIDQRHQGVTSAQEGLFAFNLSTSRAQLLATPGSDGGEISDISEFAVSPSGRYAVFIRRGDRSLWGVRLGN